MEAIGLVGETQSVSGLFAEATHETARSGAAADMVESVGAGRGDARPMTISRAAGALSDRPSIPPLRICIQEVRVMRVLSPEVTK